MVPAAAPLTRAPRQGSAPGTKKEAAIGGGFHQSIWRRREELKTYLSCVEIVLNLPLRLVPIALTLAIITIEIPAAIRPYSIAVAPDLSFRNLKTLDI